MTISQMRPIRDHLGRLLSEEVLARLEVNTTSDAPSLVDPLLHDAVRERASDIHIEPHGEGSRVRLRIDGVAFDVALLPREHATHLINQFKVMAGIDPIMAVAPQEGHHRYRLDGRHIDLRVTSATCVNGDRLAVRIMDHQGVEQRIDKLGLSASMAEVIERWLQQVEGMFLVTGPTGSGKTTTLYSILHELRVSERTIITLEDPVECEIDGISQIQVNESHGLTFAKGLRGVLRLDPDFLLVGEIRDAESAKAAVDATSSGRVLLSTLHCRDAVGAITSMRNWGMNDHEICTTVSMIVAQRLVRRLCHTCRRLSAPYDREKQWLAAMGLDIPEEVWHAEGCLECSHLGYTGRTGLFEVWWLDESDYELILAHADERALRKHLLAKGHEFLITDAEAKARAGITSTDEMRAVRGLGIVAPETMMHE